MGKFEDDRSWVKLFANVLARRVIIAGVGPITQDHSRVLAAVSANDPVAESVDVNEAFWGESLNVEQLVVSGVAITGTVLYVKAVFNVLPDETKAIQRLTAKAMLAVTNSPSNDVQWKMVRLDKDFVLRFAETPLRNCFMQVVGTTTPTATVLLGAN